MTERRLRLILSRHAKSAWDQPDLQDHDRVLNPRGLRQARELGDWLASRGYDPEEVLCSSSKRTRQTWDRVESAVLATRPDVHILQRLYNSTPDTLLGAVNKATMPVVMVIAHNPGIAEFAATMVGTAPPDPEFKRYPTSATSVIDFFEEDWTKVAPGTGQLLEFFRPTHD